VERRPNLVDKSADQPHDSLERRLASPGPGEPLILGQIPPMPFSGFVHSLSEAS
jgi:hypothetical protein